MTDFVESTIGGISCVERPGAGPAMVFLHGIGSNASSWEPILSRLPSRIRAIAWDAPGYGDSAPLSMNWPMAADYAGALDAFLDRIGVERAVVVGHSLGTLIGAAFAVGSAERVELLILASSACGYGIAPGKQLPASLASRIEELGMHGAERFAEMRAQRLVFEPRLNPKVVRRVAHAMSRVDRTGYAQAVRMLASGDLADSLRQTSVAARFIVGINDRVTPEQQTLTAARAWAKANGAQPEIVRINMAGHAVYQQKPDEFVSALLRLSSIDDSAEPSADSPTERKGER